MGAGKITKILCKSLACGLGLTAVGTGVVITVNNIIHFAPNRKPPASSTFESCMDNWDLENHHEALAVLYSLIVLAPATLISILYFYYEELKNCTAEEAATLLVRSEQSLALQRSIKAKVGIGLLQGLLLVLFVLGIFGGLIVSNQKEDASEFEKTHFNATKEQCYDAWNGINRSTFAANIGLLIPLFLVAALVSIINLFKEEQAIAVEHTSPGL